MQPRNRTSPDDGSGPAPKNTLADEALGVAPSLKQPSHTRAWTADERALRQCIERGETVVVNLRKDAHRNLALWAVRQGLLIYVGRPGWALASFNSFLVAQGEPRVTAGPWANPYAVGRDGDRDEVIAKYADGKSELQSRAPELQGKALGCWCAPEPCHGDILKQWADSGWPR
jgi:hypothetical protein